MPSERSQEINDLRRAIEDEKDIISHFEDTYPTDAREQREVDAAIRESRDRLQKLVAALKIKLSQD
jgi:hypothetical protein